MTGGSLTGHLSSSDYLLGTGLIRVNAAGSTSNFGYIKAETYDSNRSVVHIGSNYGGSSSISNSVSYDAIGIYRTCVGIGGTFAGSTLKSNYDAGIKLDVSGNVKATKFIGALQGNVTGTASGNLPLSGGTMTGAIALGGVSTNTITTNVIDSTFKELTHKNEYGYIALGPFNGDYAHIYTDKQYFYFNKGISVNGTSVSLNGHTHSNYLPKAGGTMTGKLTLLGGQYDGIITSTPTALVGALDCNNSNIINVNNITTCDKAVSGNEGLRFWRSATTNDCIWAADGVLNFSPNLTIGATSGTTYTVYHSGNISSATVGSATTAQQLSGFSKRANANATWGTLIAANGYTPVYWVDTASSGGIGISDKDQRTYFQIDGIFYQNEGNYAVLDTNTGALKSHSHTVADLPIHTYNSGAQSLSWTDTIGSTKIPTINTLAYWNGAFSGTNSNLAYCVKGAFGTIVTKNVGDYAAASHTHSYVPTKTVAFTPAETSIGPADVLSKLGSGYALGKGTWDYAGNGYISKDTTGSIAIDLAGCSVIQLGGSSAYTQLYITAPASTTTNSKTNEILFYNNHGSNYSSAWTRVLTNRNYSEYCAPASHIHNKLTIQGIDAATTHGDYMGILQSASIDAMPSGTWFNVIKILHTNSAGYYTELAQSFTGTEGLYHRRMSNGTKTPWKLVLDSANYTDYCAAKSHSHAYSFLETNGSSADVGFQCNGSQYSIAFMIGSGNVNRGIYDRTANAWWMYRASTSTTIFAGQISCDSSITAKNFITSSDRRLKKNINEISSDKLSNVLNVNFYEFDYVNSNNHSAGHIAQEIKDVLPEFVHKDESDDEMLAIDYTGLHSIQIKALLDRIIKLEEEIKILKSSK